MKFKKRFTHLRLFAAILFSLMLAANVFPVDKRSKRSSHRELKSFEKFLDDHRSIAADLYQDPSLVDNPDFMAKHPEFQQFLIEHAGLREEILAKAQRCPMTVPSIF